MYIFRRTNSCVLCDKSCCSEIKSPCKLLTCLQLLFYIHSWRNHKILTNGWVTRSNRWVRTIRWNNSMPLSYVMNPYKLYTQMNHFSCLMVFVHTIFCTQKSIFSKNNLYAQWNKILIIWIIITNYFFYLLYVQLFLSDFRKNCISLLFLLR